MLYKEYAVMSDETIDHEEEHAQPQRRTCPKCGSHDVRRSRSEGVVGMFFQMFGRWPFRCRSCRSKFYKYSPKPAARD